MADPTSDTARGSGSGHAAQSPSVDSRSRPIDPEFDRFIVWKAQRLCRLWPFNKSDTGDVEQELRTFWLASRGRFRPDRGQVRSFFKTVIERAAAQIRRRSLAQQRSPGRVCSFDSYQWQPDIGTRSSAHRNRRCASHTSLLISDEHTRRELDVQDLLESLPTPLARLCEKLMQHSVAEISRETGVPETTLRSRIATIRRRYEGRGLSEFL